MAESKAVKYDDRFGLVFDYINDHLSEDLSVDHLSRVFPVRRNQRMPLYPTDAVAPGFLPTGL